MNLQCKIKHSGGPLIIQVKLENQSIYAPKIVFLQKLNLAYFSLLLQ